MIFTGFIYYHQIIAFIFNIIIICIQHHLDMYAIKCIDGLEGAIPPLRSCTGSVVHSLKARYGSVLIRRKESPIDPTHVVLPEAYLDPYMKNWQQ